MIRRFLVAGMLVMMAGCDEESVRRAPEVGAFAPDYAAVTLAGDSVSVEDHLGEVVLLNVWATWCIPCREEIPALQRLHDRFSDQGLRIVGVSVDAPGEEGTVKEFAQSFGVTYDIWLDPAEQVINTFRVIGVPNTFLINREGTVLWKHIGPVLDDDPGLLAGLQEAL